MTKPADLNDFKKRAAELAESWKKKIGYLSDSVSRSGMDGVSHWLKSHHQIDELQAATEELLACSQTDSFNLLMLHTTLSSFNLPEEDIGQAEWYLSAHNYLESLTKTLKDKQVFDNKLLNAALNELKFISQADEFHQRYGLESIQQMVTTLYNELKSLIDDFKLMEKEKLTIEQEREKTKVVELEAKKAEALAKKAMLESVKIKEKRIAISEEKKRKLAERELLAAQETQQMHEAELLAKQAETERQAKLQDAYLDLQVEEKVSQWSIQEMLDKIGQKLASDELDEEAKQALIEFSELLQSKV